MGYHVPHNGLIGEHVLGLVGDVPRLESSKSEL